MIHPVIMRNRVHQAVTKRQIKLKCNCICVSCWAGCEDRNYFTGEETMRSSLCFDAMYFVLFETDIWFGLLIDSSSLIFAFSFPLTLWLDI